MNRFLLFLVVALLALLLTAPAASAFDWKDVVKMHEAGIADSLILQKIEYSGTTFRLGADEMEALKEAGVSDSVISAMLRTEAVDEAEDYDDYGYRYDDGYYGHPYSYPRARLYVGYGFYGPYPWYYDPYYVYPRYGRYGRVYYGYSRSYYRHGYRRYSGYDGRYGRYERPGPTPTRYRTRVGDRIDAHDRGATGYRSRPSTGTPRIATPRVRTPRSGGSGPSPTRVRGR